MSVMRLLFHTLDKILTAFFPGDLSKSPVFARIAIPPPWPFDCPILREFQALISIFNLSI